VKYLVFAGDEFYPSGGAEDFVSAFDSCQEAAAECIRMMALSTDSRNRDNWTWIHVFDVNKLKIVCTLQLEGPLGGSLKWTGGWQDLECWKKNIWSFE
jgi:hypothetical protein